VTLVWIPQNGLVHGATALPPNYAYAGKAFILQVWIGGVLQDSFTFNTPLTLSLQYRPADLGAIFENLLKLFYWDAANNAWKDAACGLGTSHDLANHLMSVQVCHASEFGLSGSTFEQKTYLPVTIH
jgi:hypothetical protein